MVESSEVRITTGSKESVYYTQGLRLLENIGQDTSNVLISKGPIENFDRLLNGEAQVGFGRLDAASAYAKNHDEFESKVESLGAVRKECVFVVVNAHSKIRSDADLQKRGVVYKIIENGDLKFIPVRDLDLNDSWHGHKIYTFEEVVVEEGFVDETVSTICTEEHMFVRTDIGEEIIGKISDVLFKNKKYISGE
jgi:TRAP-type uncharacterized transport system substrate-binding protein